MQQLVRMIAALMVVLATLAGASAVAAQDTVDPETIEVVAAAYACDDSACTDGTTPLGGTVITSFTTDGTELDSCTSDDSAGQCTLLIPAAEDGTYALVPPTGYEDYVLQSDAPQTEGQTGNGRIWTFVPAAADTDEDATTETEDEAAGEESDAADDDVESLPSTGSGQQVAPSQVATIVGSGLLALVALAVALRLRRT